MPGIFVTGTDTEVGKTFVCTQLIKLFIEDGLKVAAMKPVASGAMQHDGILKNDDALSLIEATNVISEYQNINPYVFEPAIAPHLAADNAGVKIEIEKIRQNYIKLAEISDLVVVEGAGGWYTPLSMETTMATLADVLRLPVIIVVGLRLGCLNHALLTVQAVKQSGLPVAGWIANHVEKDFSSAEGNISTLKSFLQEIPFIGSVPFQTPGIHEPPVLSQNKQTLNKQIIINSFL